MPVGKTEQEILGAYAPKYQARSIDDLVRQLTGQKSDFERVKDSLMNVGQKDLLQENENIGDLKKYLLEINNIKPDIKKFRH